MNKRIEIIDELRGIAIILMVIYHFIYQDVVLFSLNQKILDNVIIEGIRLSAEFLFIIIAGVSSSLSKSNYKRGIICIYCGILITSVTYVIYPSKVISFGILHFLGLSIIIYEILRSKIRKVDNINGIVISLMFFLLTYLVIYEEVFLQNFMNLPWMNYLRNNGYLNFIGIKSSTFVSSDYFPVVPWIFLFFIGVFIGREIIEEVRVKENITHKGFSMLRFLGRHSLLIYLVHVPIIIGILFLLNKI